MPVSNDLLLLGFLFLFCCFNYMMKKRNLPSNPHLKGNEFQKTRDNATDGNLKTVSSEIKIGTKKKDSNLFAAISHKHSSGANNWQTFLQLNPPKSNIKKNCKVPEHTVLSKDDNPKTCRSRQKLSSHKKALLIEDNSVSSIKKRSLEVDNKVYGRLFCDAQDYSKKSEVLLKFENKPVLTKQIAMDCEMVGVEIGVKKSALARISLVNAHGDCIYDKYVKPTEPVLDYRTRVSGIRPNDLINAAEFKAVQEEVADIIKDRILVGHALKNDLGVLFLSHPKNLIRDTSKFKRFKIGKAPALKTLAQKYLGVTIQDGEHSSIQDALAAMQLYKMFKKEWESTFRFSKKLNANKTKRPTPLEPDRPTYPDKQVFG